MYAYPGIQSTLESPHTHAFMYTKRKQCYSSVFSVQLKIIKQIKLTTTISWKPVRTRFLSSSQPMPPAPTTSNLQDKTFLLVVSSSTPKLAAIVLKMMNIEPDS